MGTVNSAGKIKLCGKPQGLRKSQGTQPCNNVIESGLRASYVWSSS